jgi:hypothetical protein
MYVGGGNNTLNMGFFEFGEQVVKEPAEREVGCLADCRPIKRQYRGQA